MLGVCCVLAAVCWKRAVVAFASQSQQCVLGGPSWWALTWWAQPAASRWRQRHPFILVLFCSIQHMVRALIRLRLRESLERALLSELLICVGATLRILASVSGTNPLCLSVTWGRVAVLRPFLVR